MSGNKLFGAISVIFALIALIGCSPRNETESQKIHSNEFYTDTQLTILFMRDFRVAPFLPDESYQLVNESALSNFYKNYKKDLFSKGVTGWESNFDCNRFSQYYAALSQITYFKDNFKNGGAQALAIGEVYYVSEREGPHAINVIVTPQGVLFIEPQSGVILELTETEKKSIDFIKF